MNTIAIIISGPPHDANNAILELHPGAVARNLKIGANIYLECINVIVEKKGFKVETVDYFTWR